CSRPPQVRDRGAGQQGLPLPAQEAQRGRLVRLARRVIAADATARGESFSGSTAVVAAAEVVSKRVSTQLLRRRLDHCASFQQYLHRIPYAAHELIARTVRYRRLDNALAETQHLLPKRKT